MKRVRIIHELRHGVIINLSALQIVPLTACQPHVYSHQEQNLTIACSQPPIQPTGSALESPPFLIAAAVVGVLPAADPVCQGGALPVGLLGGLLQELGSVPVVPPRSRTCRTDDTLVRHGS